MINDYKSPSTLCTNTHTHAHSLVAMRSSWHFKWMGLCAVGYLGSKWYMWKEQIWKEWERKLASHSHLFKEVCEKTKGAVKLQKKTMSHWMHIFIVLRVFASCCLNALRHFSTVLATHYGLTGSHPSSTTEVWLPHCCASTAETSAIWPKEEQRKLVLMPSPISGLACTEPDAYNYVQTKSQSYFWTLGWATNFFFFLLI